MKNKNQNVCEGPVNTYMGWEKSRTYRDWHICDIACLINTTIVPPACSALSLLPAGNLDPPAHEHYCVTHGWWQQVRQVRTVLAWSCC